MGGSRRKFKRSHAKVRVGLPRKKPREFKPAFVLPEALAAAAGDGAQWDAEGSVVKNYAAFGVIANPNLLGAHARGTPCLVQSAALQAPDVAAARAPVPEFEPIDTGSDLETDGQSTSSSLLYSATFRACSVGNLQVQTSMEPEFGTVCKLSPTRIKVVLGFSFEMCFFFG